MATVAATEANFGAARLAPPERLSRRRGAVGRCHRGAHDPATVGPEACVRGPAARWGGGDRVVVSGRMGRLGARAVQSRAVDSQGRVGRLAAVSERRGDGADGGRVRPRERALRPGTLPSRHVRGPDAHPARAPTLATRGSVVGLLGGLLHGLRPWPAARRLRLAVRCSSPCVAPLASMPTHDGDEVTTAAHSLGFGHRVPLRLGGCTHPHRSFHTPRRNRQRHRATRPHERSVNFFDAAPEDRACSRGGQNGHDRTRTPGGGRVSVR
jgi:hypothetical protein